MKKILIAIGVITTIFFACKKNENQKSTTKSGTTLVTLNGFDKNTADKMRQHFLEYRENDPSPLKTNVWFDSATVHHIVSLLQKEGSDGIRIYFASDPNAFTLHLKNSILLVSTKSSGADPSETIHQDYYEHNPTDILFNNLNSIKGIVSNSTGTETVLYRTCRNCRIDISNQLSNPHHISRTAAEQMVQGYGNHSANSISEWFDLKLFESFVKDKNYDGIRIYFATKPNDGSISAGLDAFVIIKTVAGSSSGSHTDYFGNDPQNIKSVETADGGQDQGEICPDKCN